jgi:hypothetical protein
MRFLLTLALRVCYDLLGEYEFWDYYGVWVHDYSGNSNFGTLYGTPILTDRGIYIRNSFYIQFPKNQHKDFTTSHADMVFSVFYQR